MNWNLYFKDVYMIGSRYMILATLAFVIAYWLLRNTIRGRKIQLKFPKTIDYLREIGFSALTIFVMAFIPFLILGNPSIAKHTKFYMDIHEYGMTWFVLAFPVMAFIHDTYFYWMHRLIHHPAIFKWVHLVHHKSTNPSPFAAYAFHPLEAILEAGIFVVFVLTIPVNKFHLIFFFLFQIVYNVYGHCGWELYPKGFNKHWLGKWINTSVNHNQHHQYFKGNYGLYFLFWDRMMGTIRPDYDEKFEEVKTRPATTT
ncbi:MAG: sterol desaturase family protein [Chitinophagaceae bacterium]|nr:sterol desaturase family protein [Chitinophagaceae bacterium]MBL0337135.1 sterol desaturase family protein [Chitinophagaceae bacterium]